MPLITLLHNACGRKAGDCFEVSERAALNLMQRGKAQLTPVFEGPEHEDGSVSEGFTSESGGFAEGPVPGISVPDVEGLLGGAAEDVPPVSPTSESVLPEGYVWPESPPSWPDAAIKGFDPAAVVDLPEAPSE